LTRRSQAELENTVERKTRLIGRALIAGVEHDLRDDARDDLQDTLDRLDTGEIAVRVVDAAGRIRAQSPDAGVADAEVQGTTRDAMTGRETFRIVRGEDPLRGVYAAPLFGGEGAIIGAVSVEQRLVGMSATIESTRRDAAIAVVAFVLAAAAAASWIGRVHVAAPIGRLVAAMRRVRRGELTVLGNRERTSEIQELGREFDAMVGQLAAARRELVEADADRVELERRLRRADKLIAIGQLAAGVAHEIGSPLQVLVGRARAIASRDYDAAAMRRNALIIADQGERITGIVDRLLDYARRHPERPVPTDPAEAAASVVNLLSTEADRRRVALRCVSGPETTTVLAPPGELQQIVLNLTLNAIDATPAEGEVVVDVHPARDGGAEIVVADTGRGIPADQRERVFDAFFTTRSENGGTGLGLAVVRSLVTDLGGRITLESEIGTGTRMRVWLPPPAAMEARS
jgi:signal transduction histidine kinase